MHLLPNFFHLYLDALEKVVELKPDLILMDIGLAGDMDGIETTQRIHEIIDVPVIYLSMYADVNTIKKSRSTSAFRYMNKPFNEEELKFTIEMAIESHKNAKLLKDAKKYKSVLENIPAIVYRIYVDESGYSEITLFNDRIEYITGFSLDELNNNEILFLMPLIIRKNKKDMSEHIKRLINSKKGFSLNYEIETKKGDIKSIHEKCEPVFGLEGKLKYFDGIITEILLE
ncbi:MAG: response regulator [Methanobacteriaceae archaeon]|nr:response regulator [Methanobacteriaceae archaeon]MDO9628044.1 response regulator [Methanobacteriaceae archaeon]